MTASQIPWLTVATVVKDDAAGFRMTLESLLMQDTSGIEFLVVDGSAERDEIPAILSEFDFPAQYSWSAPRGIYPAMNEAVRQARGTYIYFANAGDAFHGPGVLATVGTALRSSAHVWAYGQVRFVARDGQAVVPRAFDYSRERGALFAKGRFPPHQGVFVLTEGLRGIGGFNEDFRICADYLSILELSERADPLELPVVIADFHVGGLSSVDWKDSLVEFHRARRLAFRPRGVQALRERSNTALVYARMAIAHRLGRA